MTSLLLINGNPLNNNLPPYYQLQISNEIGRMTVQQLELSLGNNWNVPISLVFCSPNVNNFPSTMTMMNILERIPKRDIWSVIAYITKSTVVSYYNV